MSNLRAQSVTVSVPGKVILAGEYDVLQGGTAIAATVIPRMKVTVALASSHAGSTRISSDIWESTKELRHDDPTSFYGHDDLLVGTVAAAIKTWGLPELDVKVESGFDISSGFGSSSAIRLAVLSAAKVLSNPESRAESMLDCARLAYSLQKAAQARASGYDIATQMLGGLVEFNCNVHASSDQWPLMAESYPSQALIDLNSYVHVFIGGRGAPTKSLVQATHSWLDESHGTIGDRWTLLHTLSQELVDSIKMITEDRSALGRLINATASVRKFFSHSPAFPTAVADALLQVPDADKSWSWKTTGAGGEDAIIVIGHRSDIQPAANALIKCGWSLQENIFSIEPMQVDEVIEQTAMHVKMPVDRQFDGIASFNLQQGPH